MDSSINENKSAHQDNNNVINGCNTLLYVLPIFQISPETTRADSLKLLKENLGHLNQSFLGKDKKEDFFRNTVKQRDGQDGKKLDFFSVSEERKEIQEIKKPFLFKEWRRNADPDPATYIGHPDDNDLEFSLYEDVAEFNSGLEKAKGLNNGQAYAHHIDGYALNMNFKRTAADKKKEDEVELSQVFNCYDIWFGPEESSRCSSGDIPKRQQTFLSRLLSFRHRAWDSSDTAPNDRKTAQGVLYVLNHIERLMHEGQRAHIQNMMGNTVPMPPQWVPYAHHWTCDSNAWDTDHHHHAAPPGTGLIRPQEEIHNTCNFDGMGEGWKWVRQQDIATDSNYQKYAVSYPQDMDYAKEDAELGLDDNGELIFPSVHENGNGREEGDYVVFHTYCQPPEFFPDNYDEQKHYRLPDKKPLGFIALQAGKLCDLLAFFAKYHIPFIQSNFKWQKNGDKSNEEFSHAHTELIINTMRAICDGKITREVGLEYMRLLNIQLIPGRETPASGSSAVSSTCTNCKGMKNHGSNAAASGPCKECEKRKNNPESSCNSEEHETTKWEWAFRIVCALFALFAIAGAIFFWRKSKNLDEQLTNKSVQENQENPAHPNASSLSEPLYRNTEAPRSLLQIRASSQ